jgi:protein-disulfide isomerase
MSSPPSPPRIFGVRLDGLLYGLLSLLVVVLLVGQVRNLLAKAPEGATAGGVRPPASRTPPPPAPPPAEPVSLAGAILLGPITAPLVALGFTDLQCPFCGTFARDIMPELQREYIDPGRLQFALRHLPLEPKHPLARQAAYAIECAGRQGQQWAMHDRLFAKPQSLDAAALPDHARALKLDVASFSTCLGSGEVQARIDEDVALAKEYGVRGTPTFLVGVRQPDGRVKLLQRIPGAVPIEQWRKALEAVGNAAAGSR